MLSNHIDELNAASADERLAALERLMEINCAENSETESAEYVNNHIHTIYSFSPYSPTAAVYTAKLNGLSTAGIMDHDSVAGTLEFIEAGKIAKMATTVGFELRCSMTGTPFEGRRLNNPDQLSIAYLAMHGIPHQNIRRVEAFLAPCREARNRRNRAMTDKLNTVVKPIQLSFDSDILPLSRYTEGGSVTERHILYALAGKLMEEIGMGEVLLEFLENELCVEISVSNKDKLLDTGNAMYRYYLLAVLKSGLVERFYIDAKEECPHVGDFIALSKEIGAIAAYPYLGDVGNSVTGDKKTQAFEDAFLDDLIAYAAETGFSAVTYMPTRNSVSQLTRLMALCERHSLFQISGEDINSPFQTFVCEALEKPEFNHLIESTWALIGHEKAASRNQLDGMFTAETIAKIPCLKKRTRFFADLGRE